MREKWLSLVMKAYAVGLLRKSAHLDQCGGGCVLRVFIIGVDFVGEDLSGGKKIQTKPLLGIQTKCRRHK